MKQSIAYGIKKIGAPCIVVRCQDQDLYFLIDTGSPENHLVDYTHQFFTEYYNDVIKDEEGDFIIKGVSGSAECKKCSFKFSIGRNQFEESFVVLPNSQVFMGLTEKLGEPLAGILGGKFLMDHHVVIDYRNQMLYTKREQNFNMKKRVATLQ